jgi:membrane protein implicated in regulation of membrane protease activity
MRGVFSAKPGPWAVRLMIAAELLLTVTVVLVLGSARTLDQTLVAIATALVLVAAIAFILATLGERVIRERRHGR